ncbi:MAG: hypothetical protein M3304_07845 [Actinomycetota bacterium]|nr:hypothetical protein [Actinomycetota bacterium]
MNQQAAGGVVDLSTDRAGWPYVERAEPAGKRIANADLPLVASGTEEVVR